MKFQLHLRLKRAERVLERVLGLIGRRGWEVEKVSAHSPDGLRFEVTLTVSGERPAEVLLRQLAKLYDMEKVQISRPDAEHWARAATGASEERILPV